MLYLLCFLICIAATTLGAISGIGGGEAKINSRQGILPATGGAVGGVVGKRIVKSCFGNDGLMGVVQSILDPVQFFLYQSLLLHRHIVFLQELFQFPPLHNAVPPCVGFKVLLQEKQSDGDVIFSLVRHGKPSFAVFC